MQCWQRFFTVSLCAACNSLPSFFQTSFSLYVEGVIGAGVLPGKSRSKTKEIRWSRPGKSKSNQCGGKAWKTLNKSRIKERKKWIVRRRQSGLKRLEKPLFSLCFSFDIGLNESWIEGKFKWNKSQIQRPRQCGGKAWKSRSKTKEMRCEKIENLTA